MSMLEMLRIRKKAAGLPPRRHNRELTSLILFDFD